MPDTDSGHLATRTILLSTLNKLALEFTRGMNDRLAPFPALKELPGEHKHSNMVVEC